jgi:hypothetical protein
MPCFFRGLPLFSYDRPVWWTIFTIVDLYIGVVVLDAMASSLPPEKHARLHKVRLVILGMLAASGIVLAFQLVCRYGMRP